MNIQKVSENRDDTNLSIISKKSRYFWSWKPEVNKRMDLDKKKARKVMQVFLHVTQLGSEGCYCIHEEIYPTQAFQNIKI